MHIRLKKTNDRREFDIDNNPYCLVSEVTKRME